MKTPILASIALLATLCAATTQAECIYPSKPENLPDGATATRAQMVETMQVVKQFDADIAAFTACLDMELKAQLADPALDDAARAAIAERQAKRNNAAVDEAEVVASQFNEQLRAFNEVSKSAK
jgi:hypothetical protein